MFTPKKCFTLLTRIYTYRFVTSFLPFPWKGPQYGRNVVFYRWFVLSKVLRNPYKLLEFWKWRNWGNHQYSLMKLSLLRNILLVWIVIYWTLSNWLLLWYEYKSKKKGEKEIKTNKRANKNRTKQNNISITNYEIYLTFSLRERWLDWIRIDSASSMVPPMKDEMMYTREARE